MKFKLFLLYCTVCIKYNEKAVNYSQFINDSELIANTLRLLVLYQRQSELK